MTSSGFSIQRFVRVVALALVGPLMSWAAVASAQTSTGAVRGYVTGPGGEPVSDAQVVARLAATNETRAVTTNAAGFYYLPGLRPGSYEVSIRRIGFEPQTRTLQLPIGQTIDVNVSTAPIAQQLSTVQVTATVAQEMRTS